MIAEIRRSTSVSASTAAASQSGISASICCRAWRSVSTRSRPNARLASASGTVLAGAGVPATAHVSRLDRLGGSYLPCCFWKPLMTAPHGQSDGRRLAPGLSGWGGYRRSLGVALGATFPRQNRGNEHGDEILRTGPSSEACGGRLVPSSQ